ncbi:hypothetical protein [Alloactinosynnema sp. L-07]|nr:hypothetical protein [Alloactinosynnema sp. L-07]
MTGTPTKGLPAQHRLDLVKATEPHPLRPERPKPLEPVRPTP